MPLNIEINSDLNELFGFYYCEVESPSNIYLGILPYRKKSKLLMPEGKWKGWYFSEELKYAKSLGYKINVFKGYSFNRESNVFKKYIEEIYSFKTNPKNVIQKSIAKSLLNNLFGRFGIDLEKDITEIMSYNKFHNIKIKNKIVSFTELTPRKVLVTYNKSIDINLIKEHNLDVNLFEENIDSPNKRKQSVDTSSVVISAAVNAYARMYITKVKLDILSWGGNIYYSDTDSIVTDIKLPENMVHENELGKFKLENIINEGIFVTGKSIWNINW